MAENEKGHPLRGDPSSVSSVNCELSAVNCELLLEIRFLSETEGGVAETGECLLLE